MSSEESEKMVTITQKEYAKTQNQLFNFDYWWRIALMIILVVALFYMFSEWQKIDREAMACKNAPFLWGKQKAQEMGINCYYSCFREGLGGLELLPNYSVEPLEKAIIPQ